MNSNTPIVLVDRDHRRRATITHQLSKIGVYAEPFESPDELCAHWQRSGMLLVHDDGQMIAELIEHMGRIGNWLPIIGYSDHPTTLKIVKAMLDGTINYLSLPFDSDEIKVMICETSERAESLATVRLRGAMARSRVERLTRREREVLTGVANGLSNRKIGDHLAISSRTVEIHRANMLTKLGANHTSEAIRVAIEAAVVG